LFIVDSGCSKHMTGNLKLLINFVEKFQGTVKFGNDQIAPILGYGDLVQGAVTIKSVYYVKGLNHNLFSVGQFCDADLEVAFRKSTCFIRDLKGNDLLTAWLWHHHLSHLNFDTINLLSKNDIVVGLPKLKSSKIISVLLVNWGKLKESLFTLSYLQAQRGGYIFYTWTYVVPCVLVQRGLQAQVRVVRTDKGMEFLNQTLHAYFAAEGTQHQTSVARTPEQNGVVERWNCTLDEAARTMLSAAKVPLFFWAEAIATACFTQNRSLVIPRHEKSLTTSSTTGNRDECIFVGYSTQSRAYRVFNKRTRVIMESIHVNFNELPQMASAQNSSDPAPTCQIMASVQISSDPAPECQTMALEHDSLSPGRKCQENVSHGDKTSTTSNELDLLFSLTFDELLNGSSNVVSKSSAVYTVDALNEQPLAKNDEVADDEFINIFSTPVQDQGETS
nr:hypothetical protein [Tanacetum cinerariifolium]